jgi:hypothetical protein
METHNITGSLAVAFDGATVITLSAEVVIVVL